MTILFCHSFARKRQFITIEMYELRASFSLCDVEKTRYSFYPRTPPPPPRIVLLSFRFSEVGLPVESWLNNYGQLFTAFDSSSADMSRRRWGEKTVKYSNNMPQQWTSKNEEHRTEVITCSRLRSQTASLPPPSTSFSVYNLCTNRTIRAEELPW